MDTANVDNNGTKFFQKTKVKAEEWSKRIIPENNRKISNVFRKAITVALIPASAIKNLVDRIATAINGKSDVINTQKQTTPTQSATNDDAVNAISSIEIITSNDGIEKIKKELTSPGSLVCSDGIANTPIATQTIAIHELPDKYFENISSFDQLQYLPNIPKIENEITELDNLQTEIISKIKDKITELKSNSIKNDDQINNDQINKLNKLRSDIPNKINQLKDNLTNALNRLKDCANENDVKYINKKLRSCLNDWQELIKSLSENQITTSKIAFNVFTGEIQATRDSKVATNTISYRNSKNQILDFSINHKTETFEKDFLTKIGNLANKSGISKSTLLKQFLLYPGQAADGCFWPSLTNAGKFPQQDKQRETKFNFTFSQQGMTVTTYRYYKTGIQSAIDETMSYEGYILEEKNTMSIETGQKVLMPTEYSISKLTENESNPEKSITFDGNDFPKLTNTNAFPGNFPEYLKEPFKQLCEEINNQPQQTQSDPKASEENKTVTEEILQPTWQPGQTEHAKQVERNENTPMAATHRKTNAQNTTADNNGKN